jgi:hypothetical protein
MLMPKTGAEMANGQPERIRPPTYMRDVLNLSHPIEMVKHKLNFPLRMFSALTDNQDFFGEQIRDPYAGVGEQAVQTTEYIGKSLMPFGIQGFRATTSPSAKWLNVMGITKVPRLYSNTPAMNVIDEYNKQNRATMTSKQVAEEKRLKGELQSLAKAQDEDGFKEAAKTAVEDGTLTRQQIKTIIDESQAPTPGLGRFVALPVEWQVRALNEASDKEKEAWQPHFLKKVMAAKPEILIRNRTPLVSMLREMDLDMVADTIENMTLKEKASQFDLSRLGIRKAAPETDLGQVDNAVARAIQAQSEKLGTEKPKKARKESPYKILGL